MCVLFLGAFLNQLGKCADQHHFSKYAHDTLLEGEGCDRQSLLLQRNQVALWQVGVEEGVDEGG